MAGGSLGLITVECRDQFGNLVRNAMVTLEVVGGGFLNGTSRVYAQTNRLGRAVFSVKGPGKPATYRLQASVGSVRQVSDPFHVAAAPFSILRKVR